MRTAVIYARYSSERQTEQSIEGQIRECTEFAERNEIVIVDTYIDRAMTGTNDNRTDFQRMLKDSAKKPWDLILVYKLDRFSRNKYEMAIHRKTLKDNGVKLLSVKENIPDTPEGIILESLLEGMAEYYSVELAQKVRRGQRESRIKGNYAGGGVPYGYKVIDKKFVLQEDEAKVVLRIFEEYAAGKWVKDIIADLTEEGVRKRNGEKFGRTMVYGILQNERYAGIYRHHSDGVFTDTFPRIVPDNLFEAVRQICINNKLGSRSMEVVYLLRNKLVCGYCGSSICAETGTSKSGAVMRYYKCNGRKIEKKCKKATIRKDDLENLVVETTIKVLDNPENIDLIADKIFEANRQHAADTSVYGLLVAEQQEARKALDNMLKAVEQGIVTNSTKQRIEELEAKLEVLAGKIAVESVKTKVRLTKTDIKRFINKAIRKEPLQMIRMLIQKVVLYDDRVEIYYHHIDKRPDAIEHQAFSFYTEEFDYDIKEWSAHQKGGKKKIKLVMFF